MNRLSVIATLVLAAMLSTFSLQAHAQDPVKTADDAESLFTSHDLALNANKQVVYHILRDLLVAGHWELADHYLSPEYIQHNPNAASGRDAVVQFFTKILQVKPTAIPDKLPNDIVSVTAEGDLVIVVSRRTVPDAKQAGKSYTTSWFDMWRIRGGKAVEHWDPALVGEAPDLQ